ncbi:uncharacterized protein LTHEOB_1980 [Neofusicoccum parvum]|nr:uncharacterized protein LTHEOB_1980 [Neofusicoccum parvum]
MPAIVDATPAPARNRDDGAASNPFYRGARVLRLTLLALQATSFALSVAITALMSNVLYIARNVEVEDPGYVIHRASSALVVWNGAGGLLNAAAVAATIQHASTRPHATISLNITGKQSTRLPLLPTLTATLAFALARSIAASAYAFADFDRANALALPWDGDFASRPAFFTPETYAANQGWGDGTSPGVAAQARTARALCAATAALAGAAVLAVLAAWRRVRMGGPDALERVGSGGPEEVGEVGGREVVELEHRERAELGAGKEGAHEVGGKPVHEVEGEGGAWELEGGRVYEMGAGGEEGVGRRVYEMEGTPVRSREDVKGGRGP